MIAFPVEPETSRPTYSFVKESQRERVALIAGPLSAERTLPTPIR